MPRKKNLTLEDYVYFLKNPYDEGFAIDQLNQVIFMHGFKKRHHSRKNELYNALSTMHLSLMKPQRSTLNQIALPYCSALTLEQVNSDLEALGWQECPVQSVETLDSEIKKNGDSPGIHVGAPENFDAASFMVKRRKLSPKRKTVVSERDDADGFSTSSFIISRKPLSPCARIVGERSDADGFLSTSLTIGRKRQRTRRISRILAGNVGGGFLGAKELAGSEPQSHRIIGGSDFRQWARGNWIQWLEFENEK